jgi:hypothetical protein
MLQLSKIIRSRDDWKRKAVQRANEIRELRKTKKRYQEKIAELKVQIKTMEQAAEDEKKITPQVAANVVDITQAQQVRALCIMLVLQAVVSYRSVPRILNLFNTRTPLALGWIPHFTSVINWTLRLGLGMLKQVNPISKPWVAIIDHSIDIGTKKALVVLRVTIDALSLHSKAIQLKDCECISVKVCEKINGKSISMELEEIFTHAGTPDAIIKDCDSTLQKGVRLWSEKQDVTIPVIEDIGHVMANALKAQFEKTTTYKRFTSLISKGANRLRQTELVFLIPPKLRSKGRFLRHRKLGKWGDKMLNVLAVKGRAKKGCLLAKLRAALPGFALLKPFIKRFANTTKVVSQVMEILKNKGLDQTSYEQCCQLSEELPKNSKVKKRLLIWLQQHIKIQKQITSLPLLVSSDIIESLFGNFKHIIERSPQADMNRTTLLIPALCGNLDEITITQALSKANHNELKNWEQENIPYTMRKKRQAFF